MLLLKACPRCSGDLVPESIDHQVELVCLQCAYRTTAMALWPEPLPSRPGLPFHKSYPPPVPAHARKGEADA